MTKTEIALRFVRFSQWVQSLDALSDDEWFLPVSPGKWSVAEIIAHLTYWDRYFLKERYPKMKAEARLPRSIDVDVMNQKASLYAKSGVKKEELIKEFLETRDLIVKAINARSEEEMDVIFYNRGHKETLREYLVNLCEHDRHHKHQIDASLNNKFEVEGMN
ncbi:DinB family protein [Pseudalkalibacillus berkeleyi]|uniref:DinB family protein n=1 Tax=Pseudalkalibacillus berkeleyi TaxID=1069813 RepID=A0ABS9GXG6_9BACL|nr:DinB family protein [Pseudalkalibacillus berkeleyi]MCF6136356.1 DinB family protein [Pseudalkalibacillus berkeleyi]